MQGIVSQLRGGIAPETQYGGAEGGTDSLDAIRSAGSLQEMVQAIFQSPEVMTLIMQVLQRQMGGSGGAPPEAAMGSQY